MNETFFLGARPSFWEGAARVLDLMGTLNEYNGSRTAEEADARALAADWEVLGEDFRRCLVEIAKQNPEHAEQLLEILSCEQLFVGEDSNQDRITVGVQ